MPSGYTKEEREQIMAAAYEVYKIDKQYIDLEVVDFIRENPWAHDHHELVFVYKRTMIDYKVLCELPNMNDIRLRNSLVSSIDKLHKQLFSYSDSAKNSKTDNSEEYDLFNPNG